METDIQNVAEKSLNYICFIKSLWRSLPKFDVYVNGPAFRFKRPPLPK